MVRLRDVLMLAWTGDWYGTDPDPDMTLDLAGLIALTVPTDWMPGEGWPEGISYIPVSSVADWNANLSDGGNDLNRDKAEQIVNDMNGTE